MARHTYTRLDGSRCEYDDSEADDPVADLLQAIAWGEADITWNLQHGGTDDDLARLQEWLTQDRAMLQTILLQRQRTGSAAVIGSAGYQVIHSYGGAS